MHHFWLNGLMQVSQPGTRNWEWERNRMQH
jgi:hypothetical protein